jgi:hypothetical protein
MTERARALVYVRGLYGRYAAGLASGRLPHRIEVFYRNRRRHLGYDLEIMQAEGDEGAAIARTWCRVGGV